ncbi:MAG TPA: DNA-formamidopyrimidine glycosylase family protein [Planctomycetota bacterium]|nr:DNA-formamidopyrimidine glycosylase family protein [Planctomycetota bacterium]
MPELPEVEFARRVLRRRARGRAVVAVRALDARLRPPRGTFAAWRGARTAAVERRGKTLLWTLRDRDAGALLHLGMTGRLVVGAPGVRRSPYARVVWSFDDGGSVSFDDPRRFGRVNFGRVAALRAHPLWARGAPDPWADRFDDAVLAAALDGVRTPLKPALMDQGRLLGLGNIQAAEACFRARLDPRRPAASLAPRERKALRRAILAALEHGLTSLGQGDDVTYVEAGGAHPFLVYDRAGEPCPRCRAPIVRFPQAGRSTYACLACQR